MALAYAGEGSAPRDVVGMCYVVVIREPGSTAGDDVRVRFELRADLSSGRSETRNVVGIDAACEALRSWLHTLVQPH